MNTQRENARMDIPAFRAGRTGLGLFAAPLLALALAATPGPADEAPDPGAVLARVEIAGGYPAEAFEAAVVSQGGRRASVDVSRGGQPAELVELPIPVVAVKTIQADDDRLLLVGESAPAIDAVVLLRRGEAAAADAYHASNVSPSLDGRYVAATRFRPRFEREPLLLGDVVTVYDATKSPAQNRPAAAPGADPSRERTMVGKPVYPVANYSAGDYFSREEEFDRHEVRSPLAWLDGETLAFVDRSGGICSLVVIDFSNGLDAARHQEIILPVESWVKKNAAPDDAARAFRSFAVNQIERVGDGYRLVFAPSDRMALGEATIAARP